MVAVMVTPSGNFSLFFIRVLPVGLRSPLRLPIPPPTKPRPDQDLARGVGAVGAAEDVPYEEFLTSCGFAPDRSTGALPSSTDETSAKAAERRPDAAGEVDFFEHCFIAKVFLLAQVVISRPRRNDPRVPSNPR